MMMLRDITAVDMRRELEGVGYEYRLIPGVAEVCYIPDAGRGGYCLWGGVTEWTDATGLDDVIARWETRTADDDGDWSP